jgi:hypothetical protein
VVASRSVSWYGPPLIPSTSVNTGESGTLRASNVIGGAFISLCIGISNYHFQRDANRPVMAASNNLLQGSSSLKLYWTNVGQKTGVRGSAWCAAKIKESP